MRCGCWSMLPSSSLGVLLLHRSREMQRSSNSTRSLSTYLIFSSRCPLALCLAPVVYSLSIFYSGLASRTTPVSAGTRRTLLNTLERLMSGPSIIILEHAEALKTSRCDGPYVVITQQLILIKHCWWHQAGQLSWAAASC